MASISLTIPDAVLPRVRAALCANAGLPDTNPNAKEALIGIVKGIVKNYEYNAALDARPPIPVPDVADIVT